MKKICSLLLITVGAVFLIIEIASSKKNYYLQSAGIVCLMSGIFIINTSVSSRSTNNNVEYLKNNEEEE
ncbi:hypothetical protein [uncultured Aquimarina sp.]|uniref:hypothetical protein n=1 Tax=uncultured Aquimarina sp. TaxID=575652 RepID=UPI002637A284|nr:hypothetical protein [uncultured Aquimarina sp.]